MWPDVPKYDISIILPCYNVEKFVKDSIMSCLNQETTYSFEVIAVDDGSLDKTGEILDSLKAKYDCLKVIHQKNRGFSGARNAGIAQASGAAFVFVDSDDILKENALEILEGMLERSGSDYVTASYELLSEDGKCITPIKGRRNHGGACARMYSREIWRNIEFPEGYWFEDTVQAFCINGRYKETYLDKSVYLYRQNSGGITKNCYKSKRGIDSYWIIEELLNKTRELNISYDQILHDRVIIQLGPLLYRRSFALNEKERKALFVCACDLLEEWGTEYVCGLAGRWNDLEESLRNHNYALWKLVVRSI